MQNDIETMDDEETGVDDNGDENENYADKHEEINETMEQNDERKWILIVLLI